MEEFKTRRKFNGIGFHGGINCDRAPSKIEGGHEANLITKNAILQVQEAIKIREL